MLKPKTHVLYGYPRDFSYSPGQTIGSLMVRLVTPYGIWKHQTYQQTHRAKYQPYLMYLSISRQLLVGGAKGLLSTCSLLGQ